MKRHLTWAAVLVAALAATAWGLAAAQGKDGYQALSERIMAAIQAL